MAPALGKLTIQVPQLTSTEEAVKVKVMVKVTFLQFNPHEFRNPRIQN